MYREQLLLPMNLNKPSNHFLQPLFGVSIFFVTPCKEQKQTGFCTGALTISGISGVPTQVTTNWEMQNNGKMQRTNLLQQKP